MKKLLKSIVITALLAVILSTIAFAEEIILYPGEIYLHLEEEMKVVVVSYEYGNQCFFDTQGGVATIYRYASWRTDIVVPATCGGCPVYELKEYAVNNANGIETVKSLEANCPSIGKNALKGCINLESAVLNDGVQEIGENAFEGCVSLTSVTVAPSVTRIEKGAFKGCVNLKSIDLPGVAEIEEGAFEGCTNLTSVTAPAAEWIEDGAFKDCVNLTDFLMSDAATRITDYAFENCSKLKNINLPSSVYTLGEGAFKNCSSLTEMSVPVKFINPYTFYGCTSLKTVFLSGELFSIGKYAFGDCESLDDIYFDNSTEAWDSVFKDALWIAGGSSAQLHLTEDFTYDVMANGYASVTGYTGWNISYVRLPRTLDGVTVVEIAPEAFKNSSIKSFAPPYTVNCIGDRAFEGCADLEAIYLDTFYGTLRSVGEYAFKDCTSLLSFSCPGGMTEIKDGAFKNCTSLASVSIPLAMASIGETAFEGCSSLTDIYYGGSQFEWENLANSNGWLSFLPQNYTVHFATDFYYTFEGSIAVISKYYGESSSVFMSDFARNDCGIGAIGEDAFSGNEYIESVVLCQNVTAIRKNAFKDCVNLNDIFIPSAVNFIGEGAFEGCVSLTDIYFGGSPSEWNAVTFGTDWDKDVPAGVNVHTCDTFEYYLNGSKNASISKYIGTDTEVTVPANIGIFPVYRIEKNAFANTAVTSIVISEGIYGARITNCDTLQNLTLPSTLNGMALIIFNCPAIEEIRIPEGVRELGQGAIDKCDNLKRVYLPSTVEWLFRYTISGNPADPVDIYYNGTQTSWGDVYRDEAWCMVNANVHCLMPEGDYSYKMTPDGVVITKCNIEDYVLYGEYSNRLVLPSEINNMPVVGIGSELFNSRVSINELVLPEHLLFIGKNAFKNQRYITKITLPDTLLAIFDSAFEGCCYIEKLNFPENLKYVGDSAFKDCTWLEEAILSNKMDYLGADAFRNDSHLEKVYLSGEIEEIKSGTFRGCTMLKDIFIPYKVRTIGAEAFSACPYLNRVYFDFTEEKFADFNFVGIDDNGDEGLIIQIIMSNSYFSALDFTLSGGEAEIIGISVCFKGVVPDICGGCPVTSIGEGAMDDYGYSVSLTLPATIKSIGARAFSRSAETIYFKGTKTQWNAISFGAGWDDNLVEDYQLICLGSYDYTEENGEITITKYNDTLSSIEIPGEILGVPVTAIGPEAFKDNDTLTNVTISGSVKVIGDAAFENCANLADVTILQGVINIGESAFEGCGLTSVSLPKSIRTIGRYAFKDCVSLSEIRYNGFEEKWDLITKGEDWDLNLYGCDFVFLPLFEYEKIGSNTTLTKYNGYDTDVVIPSVIDEKTITRISSGVFSEGITSIYIPDTVKKVFGGAFENLTTLESVEFGRGITSIPTDACRNDSSLKEVYIPETVEAIYSRAFSCTALTDIYYGGTSEQWNSITKTFGWDACDSEYEEYVPLNYTIHYEAEHLPRYSVSRPAPEEAAATNLRRHSALRFTATSFDYNSFDIFGFLISRRDSMEMHGFEALTHKNLVSGEPLYIEAICVDDTHNRIYSEDNSGERTYSILAVVPEDKKDTLFVVRPFLTISGVNVYGTEMEGSFDDLNL